MRFDMFYELAVPEFTGLSEREVYEHSLDEIALADGAGFDGVWLVEAPADGRRPKRPDMRIFLRESSDVTPELLFKAMPLSFRRDRADGLRALYRIDLAGDGGGTWWVEVAEGGCVVTREHPGQEPDVSIRSDAETWVELARGDRSRIGVVLRRRLRVRGDRRKAAQFGCLFQ